METTLEIPTLTTIGIVVANQFVFFLVSWLISRTSLLERILGHHRADAVEEAGLAIGIRATGNPAEADTRMPDFCPRLATDLAASVR